MSSPKKQQILPYKATFKPEYQQVSELTTKLLKQMKDKPESNNKISINQLNNELFELMDTIQDNSLLFVPEEIYFRYATDKESEQKMKTRGELCPSCGKDQLKKVVQCQFCAEVFCKQCCWRKRIVPTEKNKDAKNCCQICHRKFVKLLANQNFYYQKQMLYKIFETTKKKIEKTNEKAAEKEKILSSYNIKKRNDKIKENNLLKKIQDEQKKIKQVQEELRHIVKIKSEKIRQQEERQRKQQEEARIRRQLQQQEKRRKKIEEQRIKKEEEQKKRKLEEQKIRKQEEQKRRKLDEQKLIEKQIQQAKIRQKEKLELQKKKQKETAKQKEAAKPKQEQSKITHFLQVAKGLIGFNTESQSKQDQAKHSVQRQENRPPEQMVGLVLTTAQLENSNSEQTLQKIEQPERQYQTQPQIQTKKQRSFQKSQRDYSYQVSSQETKNDKSESASTSKSSQQPFTKDANKFYEFENSDKVIEQPVNLKPNQMSIKDILNANIQFRADQVASPMRLSKRQSVSSQLDIQCESPQKGQGLAPKSPLKKKTQDSVKEQEKDQAKEQVKEQQVEELRLRRQSLLRESSLMSSVKSQKTQNQNADEESGVDGNGKCTACQIM